MRSDMPSEFREFLLSDLGALDRGKSRHRPRYAEHLYGGPYPFVQTGDIKAASGRVRTFAQTYSEAGLAQSRLWPAGTLCITIAANIAETALLTFPACFPDSIVGFIANDELCDARYVEYWFRAFRESVQQRSYGTVQENINLEVLRGLKLSLPSLQTQRQIADALNLLDDRIDLLRQTNATLESIAQALFKSWFIDFDPVRAKAEGREPEGMDAATAALFPAEFEESALGLIPKGWRIGTVEDLFVLQRGFDLPTSQRADGPFIVFAASGPHGHHHEPMVPGPGVVTGRSGVIGRVFFSHEDFWPLNTSLWVKQFKAATAPYAYQYLQTMDLSRLNAGSAVPTLNRNHVHAQLAVVPRAELVDAYTAVATPLLQRIRGNELKSAVLAELRDTLLPRLISGKLRLPEAREQLEEALA